MAGPSFEKFNYALRPGKSIERKMLCEAFSRFSPVAPLPSYTYIGFGSVTFVDFALLHRRLGIHRMISIEGSKGVRLRKRFAHNLPIKCVSLRWGHSNDILPRLSWNNRVIAWLDYDYQLNRSVFDDIQTFVANARSGSLLLITVDAESREFGENVDAVRFQTLKENVGEERIPSYVRGKDLAGWGLATVSRQIIDDEIQQTLSSRNASQSSSRWRLHYKQLFNFHYADNAKMLTVGGVIWHSQDEDRLPPSHYEDLPFIRAGDEPYLVEVPVITRHETRFMDQNSLPARMTGPAAPAWIPEKARRAYAKVYRWFPNFIEAEI